MKNRAKHLFHRLTLLCALLLVGCTGAGRLSTPNTLQPHISPAAAVTALSTLTPSPKPTITLIPTLTPRPTRTPKPTLTPTATYDPVWHATALAFNKTERAVRQQSKDQIATQVSQFPVACPDQNDRDVLVSPDGKWAATKCGYKRDQTLVVQNLTGNRWELAWEDFLHPEIERGVMGSLVPVFWDPSSRLLYFSPSIGLSGGGNQCFPGFGWWGLSVLQVHTGAWQTMIPPRTLFDAIEIAFSPTGHYFAATMQGVTIQDLRTGETVNLDAQCVMRLAWSPDGSYLAYSVATCGEWAVETSAVYVWEARTRENRLVYAAEGVLLMPTGWRDLSTLVIEGEVWVEEDWDYSYSIYEYSLIEERMTFTGTATPSP